MNREQRRLAERKRKKKDPEQLMADKVHLFGHLPEHCGVCEAEFDKKDRDMVFSWKVVVKKDKVRLFCPQCISKTKEIIDAHEQNQT